MVARGDETQKTGEKKAFHMFVSEDILFSCQQVDQL
jgi:hypothetical protein